MHETQKLVEAEYFGNAEVLNKEEMRQIVRLMEVKMMRATSIFGDDTLQNSNYKYLTASVGLFHVVRSHEKSQNFQREQFFVKFGAYRD